MNKLKQVKCLKWRKIRIQTLVLDLVLRGNTSCELMYQMKMAITDMEIVRSFMVEAHVRSVTFESK